MWLLDRFRASEGGCRLPAGVWLVTAAVPG